MFDYYNKYKDNDRGRDYTYFGSSYNNYKRGSDAPIDGTGRKSRRCGYCHHYYNLSWKQFLEHLHRCEKIAVARWKYLKGSQDRKNNEDTDDY